GTDAAHGPLSLEGMALPPSQVAAHPMAAELLNIQDVAVRTQLAQAASFWGEALSQHAALSTNGTDSNSLNLTGSVGEALVHGANTYADATGATDTEKMLQGSLFLGLEGVENKMRSFAERMHMNNIYGQIGRAHV